MGNYAYMGWLMSQPRGTPGTPLWGVPYMHNLMKNRQIWYYFKLKIIKYGGSHEGPGGPPIFDEIGPIFDEIRPYLS